jgi:hypothetical protein
MTSTDWIFLVSLALVLVGFVLALQPFFSGKLVIYVVGITVSLSALPNIVFGTYTDIAVAACYITISLFVSSILWDSRQFIIDNFSFFGFALARPAYILAPFLIGLVIGDIIPLKDELRVWIVGFQILIAAISSETTYSLAKRNNLLYRTRRASLPRMETLSGQTPTNQMSQTLV